MGTQDDGTRDDPGARPAEDARPPDGLSPAAAAIWADAVDTSWGRDNGESFYRRIEALPDPADRIRLSRLFMDRQHASLRALQQVVYDTWRRELPSGDSPVDHRAGYRELVDDGADFRRRFADLVDTAGSDPERAELLTVLVDDGARWLGELRERRDEAIMEALASGLTPRQLAARLRMSKTQIVNVRHRYLRELDIVGAHTRDIVYRSSGGLVTSVNDAFEVVTGIPPTDVIGHSVLDVGHPDDQAVVMPTRDEAVRRGFGRFRHQLRLRTATGGWTWVDADFSVLTNPDTGSVEVHARAWPVPTPAAVPEPAPQPRNS
jgi:PAS domain S-box-containing protein